MIKLLIQPPKFNTFAVSGISRRTLLLPKTLAGRFTGNPLTLEDIARIKATGIWPKNIITEEQYD